MSAPSSSNHDRALAEIYAMLRAAGRRAAQAQSKAPAGNRGDAETTEDRDAARASS